MTIPEGLLDSEPDNDEFGCYAEPILQLLIERPDVVGPHAAKITPALFPLSELRCKYIAAAIGELREKFGGPPTRRMIEDYLAKKLTVDDPQWEETLHMVHSPKLNPVEIQAAADNLKAFIRKRLQDQLYSDEFLEAQATMDPVEFGLKVNAVMAEIAAVNHGDKPRFKVIDSDEFDEGDYDLDYLIDGVLVDKQPCVIGGPKKGLKTSIAVDLAVSLAKGGHFIGKFPVKTKTRVMVISAESGNATLRDTARRVCRAAGCTLASLKGWLYWVEDAVVPKILDDGDMAAFIALLIEHKPGVVVIDPLYKMLDGDDAGNLFKMGGPLEKLGRACLDHNAVPVVLHHFKSTRANPHDPADLDDLTFSGCAEYFRQWLLVNRREKYEPNSGHHELWLTIGGSAGHSSEWAVDVHEGTRDDPDGRRWQTDLMRSDDARKQAKEQKETTKQQKQQNERDEWSDAVLRTLDLHPAGASKSRIEDYTAVPKRQVGGIIAELLQQGQIETCQVRAGNNNKLYDGFRRTRGSTGPPA